jgi:hypothetical protein
LEEQSHRTPSQHANHVDDQGFVPKVPQYQHIRVIVRGLGATAGTQSASIQPDADIGRAIQASFTQASRQVDALEKEKNNIIKPDSDRYE